jgi:ribose 5-phosphate isomerase B
MKNYNIFIANDHNGYLLKNIIISHLKLNYPFHKIRNLGCDSQEKVDYPEYGKKLVTSILDNDNSLGILICSTGIGMSIVANRRVGIRAALCFNEYMAVNARSHHNANILIIGAKIIDENSSYAILDKFLNTPFEGGRHAARLAKLD